MTFAPLQTIAMRNIQPRMAGAASGIINTTRQLGAVIGSAAVGALLQNQIAVKLAAAAQANASALPEQYRGQFVAGFEAASGNLQVGAGQTGIQLPPGIPPQARDAVVAAATKTFHEGYIAAMRVTLILPIAILALAALSCLLVRRRKRPGAAPAAAAAEAPIAVEAG
jgi:hypothetical protein